MSDRDGVHERECDDPRPGHHKDGSTEGGQDEPEALLWEEHFSRREQIALGCRAGGRRS